ncbi:MAG: STAS domain-containing protein [Anaerolineae bacterium]|jgi:anti-sigma B factor antagonist
MEITTTKLKRCDLVKVSGRIDSQTAPELAEAFNDSTEAGRYRIAFDMDGVEFISSAGLRVLIDTQKKCKRFNRGQVVLTNVPKKIYDALDLAGFVPLFEIYETAVEAVGSF